ncbi:SapC family protein [Parvularcula marina]|uniref:Peptide ABC transporter permease n=1 Tax=Parvularcula marina TaxID=2292771 RepID=A0A371RFP3_9PROT|nr:SapC family protein [Parvularcula marina]RFB04272.1 peptide ABC transporter permease [Parvularcula marina]
MTNTAVLNNVDHHDLKFIPPSAPTDADKVNQVLVFPTEFPEVQREFPIFFRKGQDGAFQPVALLGLDKDENLFLGPKGWRTRYIPAIITRGPFLIGLPSPDNPQVQGQGAMIQVDLDDPRLSRTDGVPLFLPHGGNAPFLNQITGVLQLIHAGHQLMAPMFAAFEEAGLIEPVTVEINTSDTNKYVVPDMHTISAEAMSALSAEQLKTLHDQGFLHLAYMVLSSTGNVSHLIDLKNMKQAG